jgi:Mce-associated membrane protein
VISSFSVHDPEGPDADVDSGAIVPVTEPGTENEVAKAEARAEAARARLVQLRRSAETGDADDDTVSRDVEQRPAKPTRKRLRLPRPRRPRWLRHPGRKTIAVGAGIAFAFASLGASGYILWQHHTAVHKRQLAAELTAAARQGVTALMTIDPDHAKDSVQHMIDASTGDQKNTLSVLSTLIVQKAQDTKVGSTVTVEAVAVTSVSDNSGVALVAAKTTATGRDGAKSPPALFRLTVTMDRDGGQLKMSKVDFLQ